MKGFMRDLALTSLRKLYTTLRNISYKNGLTYLETTKNL